MSNNGTILFCWHPINSIELTQLTERTNIQHAHSFNQLQSLEFKSENQISVTHKLNYEHSKYQITDNATIQRRNIA